MLQVEQQLSDIHKQGLLRKRQPFSGAQGAVLSFDGTDYLNFSSNDYLGLANDPRLKECMIEAVQKYGVGAGASQLIVGYSEAHQQLEERLAEFLNRDAAIIFSSGYLANLAIASSLIDKNTVVIQDKLNHASIIDAAMLSAGKLIRYPHSNMERLASLLDENRQSKKIVMTDGIFSMDGDAAKLVQISELCHQYGALLVVDDAHGIGVLGETGGGLIQQLDLEQTNVPLLIGTFGKAFGAAGAFIAGEKALIEIMVQKARSYIYTTGMLPAAAATMVASIDLVEAGVHLRRRVEQNVLQYKDEFKYAGQGADANSHIQPVIFGDIASTVSVSETLFDRQIIATPIRPPTVPKGASRLRLSFTAVHQPEQISALSRALNEAVNPR